MATALKNLSEYTKKKNIDISNKKFAVVVSEYNPEITEALYEGVTETLLNEGAKQENIFREDVPGAFELTLGAQYMAQIEEVDAVIILGCVIQGETKHFDFICDAVAQGITNVSLKYNKPVIFGLLTPNTQQQALDRAGGKHGNKGVEAAVAAIKMLGFNQQ
ncbi:6,7-dimethyl-8-ribityllumazine synthase [Limibacter armeniacum]|uniref:6,7-dimethyl-8-ribityllumazine synthase n=1 Tax=Limibacter armeniacum TaxID=466084 RepID=UPI002FE592A2